MPMTYDSEAYLDRLYLLAVRQGGSGMLGTPSWWDFSYNGRSLNKLEQLGIDVMRAQKGKFGDWLLRNATLDQCVMDALTVYVRANSDPNLSSRFIAHIGRLTDPHRTSVEKAFGLALLRVWRSLPTKELDSEKLRRAMRVMNSESLNTVMGWTLGPYLYNYFRDEGLSEKGAVFKFLGWLGKVKDGDIYNHSTLTLRGLEGRNRVFFLSDKSDHITHICARLWAAKIAELL